jgi:imidazolonepropionase-like amidohydrolase
MPSTTEQARANVRETNEVGVDAIKIIYSDQAHTGGVPVAVMPREIMAAIIDEAHLHGLKAYVHAPTLIHAKEALRAGADALAHSVADAPIDDDFIDLMRQNDATYTSTLALYTSFAGVAAWMRSLRAIDVHGLVPSDVYARYESEEGARAYHAFFGTFPGRNLEIARSNVRRLAGAGITVLAGTDTGVTGVLLGVSSQRELELLVEAGLTPAEALRAATLSPAHALGLESEIGSVEENKLADLLILDANPLTSIGNTRLVHRVMRGGVLYDPIDLLSAPGNGIEPRLR